MKDLVILAADKSMEQALKGLVARPEALGIRPVTFDIFVHPERDPGCLLRGVRFLDNSRFLKHYRCGLLVFDHEGCGKEQVSPADLKESLNEEFSRTSWSDRARAIVLVPELEAWVWSNSPHVEDVVGWKTMQSSLYSWLRKNGWLEEGQDKPERPKEAFEAALRTSKKRRSSSLYLQIAQRVSFVKCEDKAFQELTETLNNWFPQRD